VLSEIAARTVVFASEHPERTHHRVGPRARLADRFLGSVDRRELRLSAITWLALRTRSWAGRLDERLHP
jgi:hypothetical protein